MLMLLLVSALEWKFNTLEKKYRFCIHLKNDVSGMRKTLHVHEYCFNWLKLSNLYVTYTVGGIEFHININIPPEIVIYIICILQIWEIDKLLSTNF